MTDGRTHWEGCWREHRDCAVAEVERLRSRLAKEEGKTSAALEAAGHIAEKNSALKARLAEARRWIESAHQVGCSQWPDVDGQVSWKPCDCGRDAFLAGEKP
jgi:hypothetical protein